MRAHGLLSPHRGRQGDHGAPRRDHHHRGTPRHVGDRRRAGAHGGRRLGWTFAAVDHWNAECVRWHVCKVGHRFAALEPIAQGLRQMYGSVEADVCSPHGWRCGWTTGVSTCRTTSSIRSNTGASVRASASSRNPKPTGSPSAGIGRSRSKRSTAGSFRTIDDVRRGRRRFRRALQPELAPAREAVIPDAHRMNARNLPATGRVVQTSVQETGCGTPGSAPVHQRRRSWSCCIIALSRLSGRSSADRVAQ